MNKQMRLAGLGDDLAQAKTRKKVFGADGSPDPIGKMVSHR